jgi:hypothetical protein
MNKFSPKEQDDLLKEYFTDQKMRILSIIICSALILIMAILIIILSAKHKNKIYENEEILQGYVPLNSITAKYRIHNPSQNILLFNDSYTNLIHTLRIDGNKLNNVTNEYKFDTSGVHTVKMSFKKALRSSEKLFADCENLIEINLTNLTSERINSTVEMFSGCTNLINVDFTNFDSSNLKNASYMFHNCSSLYTLDFHGFQVNELKDISGLFYGCTNLSTIHFNYFYAGKVIII